MRQIAIDGATEAFLETAALDLQRQVGASASVESVRLEHTDADVEMIAALVVAGERMEVRGRGESVLRAYAGLWRSTSLPVLASAYRQVLGL